jgi:3-oxoacyl-[acyl-carrier protein] reductase
MQSKNAIITGASQGLGLAIAKSFIQNNINVLICARDISKLKTVQKDLAPFANNSKIYIKQTDVSKESDIKDLYKYAFEVFDQVHVLINNAGIYGPMGAIESLNFDLVKECMDINFYGSVLMCKHIVPHFKKNKYGKIIQLGGAGFAPTPYLTPYASSKAAIIRFINSLSKDLEQYNVYANSIAPGLSDTQMLDQVLEAGKEKVGEDFYNRMLKAKTENKTVPFDYACKLCLFLASDKSLGITGKHISAFWDKYENWSEHINEIKDSDIWTMQRITGKERNITWGDK